MWPQFIQRMLLGDCQAAFTQYKTADVSMCLVIHGISNISLFGKSLIRAKKARHCRAFFTVWPKF
jgi:hypothetical protein